MTSKSASALSNADQATMTALAVKHAAQMQVTKPTSRSFFLRPLDSMGKRLRRVNNLPPYSMKPAAAERETIARKMQDITLSKASCLP